MRRSTSHCPSLRIAACDHCIDWNRKHTAGQWWTVTRCPCVRKVNDSCSRERERQLSMNNCWPGTAVLENRRNFFFFFVFFFPSIWTTTSFLFLHVDSGTFYRLLISPRDSSLPFLLLWATATHIHSTVHLVGWFWCKKSFPMTRWVSDVTPHDE